MVKINFNKSLLDHFVHFIIKPPNFHLFCCFILICYLLFNTGIVSDDFPLIQLAKSGLINLFTLHIDRPLLFVSQSIFYYFIGLEDSFLLNFWKIFYVSLSIFLSSRFFGIFMDRQRALMASFLFVFFPTHDSTTYWAMGHGYFVFPISLFLYSYYLAHYEKLKAAFSISLLASFISYSTPPIALSLSVLFLLQGKYKKASVITIPCILYSFYFLTITEVFGLGSPRLLESISIYALIKQFVLQILTFIDSMFGPSIWLKIYYSFSHLNLWSFVVAVPVIVFIYKNYTPQDQKYDKKLLFALILMVILAFAMFASTGRYPQLAFNLGNRTTTYGSLLIAYLIVLIPRNLGIYILGILLFSIFGISSHWKDLNINQQRVLSNIRNNQELRNYSGDKTIFVSGNQYSKFGPISHIEFMSEHWVPSSIFKSTLEKSLPVATINKRFEYVNGYLLDTKYKTKQKIKDFITIYDSKEDKLFNLPVNEINNYLDSLPIEARHWILLSDNTAINYIRKVTIYLMPRLKYALVPY